MKALRNLVLVLSLAAGITGLSVLVSPLQAGAAVPAPGPQSGTVGVEGTIPSDPPRQAATIATPANGQTFTTIPVTVRGICPADTLVKIFSNEIFVGSAICTNGSYSVEISLFSGRNDLIARVFDNLDQQGPDSAVTTVTFNDARFGQFGSHVLITSQYARRAADPNTTLEWPVIVSNGLGPYALTVDWGDGSAPDLRSEPFAGTLTFSHSYKSPGIYRVTFKVVDRNGTIGYLQVVAVSRGEAAAGSGSGGAQTEKTIVTERQILLWPIVGMVVLAFITFWLGQKYAVTRLRRQLEREYH